MKKIKFLNHFNEHIEGIQYNTAFTISEVLITLLIIGLVAVMVIPPMIQSTNNRENIASLKKVYSQILSTSNSINYLDNNNGYYLPMDSNAAKLNLPLMGKYMRFQKICTMGASIAEGCWYPWSQARTRNEGDFNYIQTYATWGYGIAGILQSGQLIGMCDNALYVDTNGFTGPNQEGIDVFAFVYDATKKTYVPAGYYALTIDYLMNKK